MNYILYLHGFASSSDSTKAKVFKEYLKQQKGFDVIIPDLPNNLIDWSDSIEYSIKKYNPIALIGSSLGGFYSTYFARKLKLIDILLNPAVLPAEGMKKYLGTNINYSTGKEFELTIAEIEHLSLMERALEPNKSLENKSLVILETGDEVLDYKKAVDFYANSHIKIIRGGSHSLDSFDQHLEQILIFIKNALK
ncbi:MAG: YqiA/YcfP family alpha/beta fold hydrolase [Gammaproteobacteria bacterium]